jgi:hypothetical protein
MILGSEDTVRGMIGNVRQKERFTSLAERILELSGEESAYDASRRNE